MFQVYNALTGKRLYIGFSGSFALSFVEVLKRRGIPHRLVIQ